MIGIYKITSPSEKVYVGQSINIEDRWKKYERFLTNKKSVGPKIYNSLQKYSPENHIFEIIEECSLEQLNEREAHYKQQFINEFGWKMALFCELYDNGGGPRSEEIKNKIKIYSMGKNSKCILQYDLDGNFIQEWSSIKKAEDQYKKGIKEVLVKKIKTAGGYIWRYKEDPLSLDYKLSIHKSCKKVYQFDLNNNFIKEWNSVIEIQKELNFPNSNISTCCNKKQKTAYGFKWSYENK
jgi:group I intron endonuclease